MSCSTRSSKPHLLIFPVIEAGILEPRPHYPCVARCHQCEIPWNYVGNGHKIWEQRAGAVRYGKVALVLLYDRNQQFGGKFEILVFELPDERLRELDQLCDFIQKLIVGEDLAADPFSSRLRSLPNEFPPLGYVQDDVSSS